MSANSFFPLQEDVYFKETIEFMFK